MRDPAESPKGLHDASTAIHDGGCYLATIPPEFDAMDDLREIWHELGVLKRCATDATYYDDVGNFGDKLDPFWEPALKKLKERIAAGRFQTYANRDDAKLTGHLEDALDVENHCTYCVARVERDQPS